MAAWECRWSNTTSIPRGNSEQKGASAIWSTPSSAAQCASGTNEELGVASVSSWEAGCLQFEPTGVSGRRAPGRMARREYVIGLPGNLGRKRISRQIGGRGHRPVVDALFRGVQRSHTSCTPGSGECAGLIRPVPGSRVVFFFNSRRPVFLVDAPCAQA